MVPAVAGSNPVRHLFFSPSLAPTDPGCLTARQLLNKVPEVTLYFWLITCLCTTIGETLSDNLTTSWAGGDSAGVNALNSASVLGTSVTSYIFLGIIVPLVAFLQIRKPDPTPVELPHLPHPSPAPRPATDEV